MRRILSVLLVVAFLLLVPVVSASASTVYEFYPVEPVATYSGSADFVPGDGIALFGYAGVLPEGTYSLTLCGDFDGVPFEVLFDPMNVVFDDDLFAASTWCRIPVLSDESFPCDVVLYIFEDVTLLSFSIDIENFELYYDFIDIARLYPESPQLSFLLAPNTLDDVYSQVLGLLPIALSAFVGFLGLRKAIAWLQSVLHGA